MKENTHSRQICFLKGTLDSDYFVRNQDTGKRCIFHSLDTVYKLRFPPPKRIVSPAQMQLSKLVPSSSFHN